MNTSAMTARATSDTRRDWTLHATVFGITLLSEMIGFVHVPLGSRSVVLLPLIWAVVLGACVSVIRLRYAGRDGRAGIVRRQHRAGIFVQISMLLFLAKLGLLAGADLSRLAGFGPALALQEVGHLFGTSLVALPVALLLGVKREAIGSTFSIGREPSLGIIAERFGMTSPEGRGVLAEYISSTLFGTLFISLLAGVVAGLGIFDYRALAMGAGIGSSGMMAAAASTIAATVQGHAAHETAALAAMSNLITNLIGTYFTLFVSLPFVQWLYARLEPALGKFALRTRTSDNTDGEPSEGPGSVPASAGLVSLLVVGASALVCGVWMKHAAAFPSGIVGLAVILAIALISLALRRFLPVKVPAVCWVSLAGMLAAAPVWPGAHWVNATTSSVDFISLAVPVLAYAGLSVGKDMAAFRKLGWRLVLVSAISNAGSFLGAALIAQWII